MGEELKNLAKVWFIVFASLCYVYFIVSKISKHRLRLLSLAPIVALFTILPLYISSIHLCGLTAFFVTWLCSFKLLLFAFNQGPLSSSPLPSLLHFISIACLPIKLQSQTSSNQITQKGLKSPLNYAIKALLLAIVIHIYDYKPYLHQDAILALYCCHMYFSAEILLAMSTAPARAVFGFEIEPHFNEPYLSTSLQDFWGKRWNLMVPSILRPTVYNPIRYISNGILGKQCAQLLGVVGTFVVSGLMHELIYFYFTRVKPTWEVTWFFVLQGFCLALEIVVKKAVSDKWRLHRVVSGVLTIGFVVITGFWLFFPQLNMETGLEAKKIKFTVEDDKEWGDENGDEFEEESYLFDSVCAICDDGGEILWYVSWFASVCHYLDSENVALLDVSVHDMKIGRMVQIVEN
ncbi:hypothetical protein GIB67_039119 [Kingdonia uniflora]|uniref:Wax synthase domain-containing protein n=1 Tax=Kingdonia uniflora TaxID=39325 RepID=A0A7J7L895_9MAGN|nr:hypothetical protein GIB67_039119 [Kingdonia uniflora]